MNTAYSVAMRLENVDDKFLSDLGRLWQSFRDEDDQIAEDDRLPDTQKFPFLLKLPTKDAHRFFLERVEQFFDSYYGAFELVQREVNSVVRQT